MEDAGLLVTLEFRIDPNRAKEFRHAMRELGRIRRRDGALPCGDGALSRVVHNSGTTC